MLRGFVAGVLTVVAVGLIGGYVVLRSGLVPANADAQPGSLETWAAKTSLRATLAREAPKGPDPIAATDDNLIAGVELYAQHCAICHGTATRKPVCFADCQGRISKATATVDRRGGGRSRRRLCLEDYARHPLDRDALVERLADRPADLDPGSLPETHE